MEKKKLLLLAGNVTVQLHFEMTGWILSMVFILRDILERLTVTLRV